MVRSTDGTFIQKGDEPRAVRSIRLTDSTWQKMGDLADTQGITRADLIEDLFLSPQPSNTRTLPDAADLLNQVKGKFKTKLTLRDVEAILELL
jgi:hypothetical protein